MKSDDFFSQYKDPRWQKKRLQIMERDAFVCICCGDEESPLNVHHKKYIKDKKIWEYDDNNLSTLCESCHKEVHEIKEKINDCLSDIPEMFLREHRDLIIATQFLWPNELQNITDLITSLKRSPNGNI
jgi:hypothetical protein